MPLYLFSSQIPELKRLPGLKREESAGGQRQLR
jgi:hypothetical protein